MKEYEFDVYETSGNGGKKIYVLMEEGGSECHAISRALVKIAHRSGSFYNKDIPVFMAIDMKGDDVEATVRKVVDVPDRRVYTEMKAYRKSRGKYLKLNDREFLTVISSGTSRPRVWRRRIKGGYPTGDWIET